MENLIFRSTLIFIISSTLSVFGQASLKITNNDTLGYLFDSYFKLVSYNYLSNSIEIGDVDLNPDFVKEYPELKELAGPFDQDKKVHFIPFPKFIDYHLERPYISVEELFFKVNQLEQDKRKRAYIIKEILNIVKEEKHKVFKEGRRFYKAKKIYFNSKKHSKLFKVVAKEITLPKYKLYSKKEFNFFYWLDYKRFVLNGNLDTNSIEIIKDRLLSEVYFPNFTFRNLMNIQNFTETTLPYFIINIIDQSLTKVKRNLPDSLNNIVKDVKITYGKKQQMLWVVTHDNEISISPYLIKALFLTICYRSLGNSGGDNGDFNFFTLQRQLSLEKKQNAFTPNQLNDYSRRFINEFEESLFFILGHELAHIYLGLSSNSEDSEIKCDYYSFKNLNKNIQGASKIGIFDDFVKRSIDNDLIYLWGVNDPTSLKKRYNLLLSLIQSEEKR